MTSVNLGFFDTPIHEATAAAIIRVFEAHGINNIELITGDYADLFSALKQGEIDVFASVWLPDVHTTWSSALSAMKPIGNLYQPSLFWSVPAAVANQIQSIDELANNTTIERKIIVAESIFDFTKEIFDGYDLNRAGYHLHGAEDEEAIQSYQKAIDQGKPVIIPLFQPSILDIKEKLCHLQDPKKLLKSTQNACILIRSEITHTLDSDLIDELEAMSLGNQVVQAMEEAMRTKDMDAHEAAEAWQRGKLIVRV